MRSVNGGQLHECSCANGNSFKWSDLHRSPSDYQSYANAVCNGGSSSCTAVVILLPQQ